MDLDKIENQARIASVGSMAYKIVLELVELTRKQEQALIDRDLALMKQTELADRCRKQAETMEAERDRMQADRNSKQAEIDRLMLEFCHDEMSAEQMSTWEASQRKATEHLPRTTQTVTRYALAAPQQHAQPLPKWIDEAKGRDPFTDGLIAYIEVQNRTVLGAVATTKNANDTAVDFMRQRDEARAVVQQHAQAAQPKCKTCDGQGVVDDGEINHYPNGEPYMNGPVKCVKDCPDCSVAGNAQAALSDEQIMNIAVNISPEDYKLRDGMLDYESYDLALARAILAGQQPAAAPENIMLSAQREKRAYIAGPMTGIADYNFPAFNAMAVELRGDGWHVENPAEHGIVNGADWADYLRYDIARIATCDTIVLLPGWSNSKGANLEVYIAQQLGMHVKYSTGAETAAAPAIQQEGAALDEWRLRRLLCLVYAKQPYLDDGELQDNSTYPVIDFKRSTVDQIEAAMQERTAVAFQKIAAQEAAAGTSVDEWLGVVESYGPYGTDINFGMRCQIVLAEEVKRLRAALASKDCK